MLGFTVSPWDPDRFATTLVRKAQVLVGGSDAALIIDDTAPVKQGKQDYLVVLVSRS